MNNDNIILDPIKVSSVYAVYSTYVDDIIFSRESVKNPIFTGGIVKEIHKDAFNFKPKDFVGFISYAQNPNLRLSSNMLLPITEKENVKLFAILPYASFAMKILRIINPSLGQTILMVGEGFFFSLLKKILDLSGVELIVLNSSMDLDKLIKKNIDVIIYLDSNAEISEIISKLHPNHHYELRAISQYDIGLDDDAYRKGVKYPYSYIRWDFRKNLEYFINLAKRDIEFLDFFEVNIIDIEDFDNMTHYMNDLKENLLYLFRKVSD
jgi:hypothetical protein